MKVIVLLILSLSSLSSDIFLSEASATARDGWASSARVQAEKQAENKATENAMDECFDRGSEIALKQVSEFETITTISSQLRDYKAHSIAKAKFQCVDLPFEFKPSGGITFN